MAAPKPSSPILCPSCGARNPPLVAGSRCVSCGAPMDVERPSRSSRPGGPGGPGAPGRGNARRPTTAKPRGFSVVWCGVALIVQSVLTAALVFGLPMAVTALDFEGSNGMAVAIPVWFLGGLLLGMISPGKTFAEPVIASFIVQIPTLIFLWKGQTVRTMPLFMYVILGLIGVLFTLVGAYLGERIQMGPPPRTAE